MYLVWDGGNVADIIMGTDKVLALPVSQSNREIEHQQAMATLGRPFVWTINLTVSSITLVKQPLSMSMGDFLDYIN